MNKPEYYTLKPMINFFSVIKYIEEKYNIEACDPDNKNFDYFDHFDSHYWITNGSTQCLPVAEFMKDEDYEWVRKFSSLIYDEFGEDEMNVYISW